MSSSRILVFGDSNTDALKRAHKLRGASANAHIRPLRLSKVKRGIEIGDVAVDAAIAMVAESTTDVLIASTIGGNQHQVFGLVQHPVAFDFIEPDRPGFYDSQASMLMPYQVMWSVFEAGLRKGDGRQLTTLREAGGAPSTT